MPNLDHDPQNPTDLMDRPIAVGDIVAWGTTYGRSAAIAVCEIEKIRFVQDACAANGWKRREVPQHLADDYTLILRPIKSTGRVSHSYTYHPNGFVDADGYTHYYEYDKSKAKPKSVQLVKNIVKLEPLNA